MMGRLKRRSPAGDDAAALGEVHSTPELRLVSIERSADRVSLWVEINWTDALARLAQIS